MISIFQHPFEVDVLKIRLFDDPCIASGRVRVIAISEIEAGWFTASRSRFLCVTEGGKFGWVDVADCTKIAD
jgi:hypothetical protein